MHVFMDESKSTPDTWAVKECVCDGTCEGRSQPENMCIISAINPTRLKPKGHGQGTHEGLEGTMDVHAYYDQLQRDDRNECIHESFAAEPGNSWKKLLPFHCVPSLSRARNHPQPHVGLRESFKPLLVRRASQDPHDRVHRGCPEFHQRHGVPLGQQQCEPSGCVALRAIGSLASWAFRKAPPCRRSDAVSGPPGHPFQVYQVQAADRCTLDCHHTLLYHAPQPGRERIP